MSSNFAILGVGGSVAPRHLKAIRDTYVSRAGALPRAD